MRAETKSAKIEDRRSQVQAFDLLALANVLSRTGLLPVTCVAALKVYELASGSMTRFIQAGPRLKLGKWFLPSVTLLEAMMDVGAGIYEPDPTVVFRPFADTLRAYRMLTYITETAAAKAFDLTLGRWTTQVYHAGMPIVCQRLRHLILYESDESGAVVDRHLSSVGFGAVPSHALCRAPVVLCRRESRPDRTRQVPGRGPVLRTPRLGLDAGPSGRPGPDLYSDARPAVPARRSHGRERPLPTLHCQAGDDLVVLREFCTTTRWSTTAAPSWRAPSRRAPSRSWRAPHSSRWRMRQARCSKRPCRARSAPRSSTGRRLRSATTASSWRARRSSRSCCVDIPSGRSATPTLVRPPCLWTPTWSTLQPAGTKESRPERNDKVLYAVPHGRRRPLGRAPPRPEAEGKGGRLFAKDSVQMWGECGQLIQATRDFQAKLKELNDGRNADPRLAERHWAEARLQPAPNARGPRAGAGRSRQHERRCPRHGTRGGDDHARPAHL